MALPKFKSAYSEKLKTPIIFNDESLAIQSAKNDCDINQIMAKYQKTGFVSHATEQNPEYGVNSAITYHDALNTIIASEQQFNELPSDLRKTFHNDPGEFLAFVDDENNYPKMIEMGLMEAPTPPPEVVTTPQIVEPTPMV